MANDMIFDDELLASLAEDETTLTTDEFDTDADYSAPPPPLPDGNWQVKLVLTGVKDEATGNQVPFRKQAWGNIPETYYTTVEGIVVDPGGPQDGKRTNRFNVTTHPEARRNNASAASMVYRAITGKPIPGLKPAAHMGFVIEELKGVEPIVWVKTQLEGQSPEASKAYGEAKKAAKKSGQLFNQKAPKTFRGQKAFTDENGKLTGKVIDEVTGEIVVGRPAIQSMSFDKPIGA